MQRRHFLKLGALGVAGTLAADFRLRAGVLPSTGEPLPRPDGKAHRLRQFLLDDRERVLEWGAPIGGATRLHR